MGMAKLGPLDPFVVATGLTLYTPITIRIVLVYCQHNLHKAGKKILNR